jgi:hypothetical protein
MSSPIHLDEDTDPTLIYAPPWARERDPSVAEAALRSRAGTRAAPAMSSGKLKKPKFSGDRAMLELKRQLALDPDLIPEPPSTGAAVIRPLLIRLCGVSAVAALVAWGLVSYSSVKKTVEIIPADASASEIASDRITVVDVQPLHLRPTISQTAQAPTLVGNPPPIAVSTAEAGVAPPAPVAVTTPAAAETPAIASAPPQRAIDRRSLQLDSDGIAILIKRGKDLLADGDLAAARLLLRRAAEAGSVEGAFALGTTFNPVALQRLGAVGAVPDLAQARQWYQRAAELGSSAASQQLAGLGDDR